MEALPQPVCIERREDHEPMILPNSQTETWTIENELCTLHGPYQTHGGQLESAVRLLELFGCRQLQAACTPNPQNTAQRRFLQCRTASPTAADSPHRVDPSWAGKKFEDTKRPACHPNGSGFPDMAPNPALFFAPTPMSRPVSAERAIPSRRAVERTKQGRWANREYQCQYLSRWRRL